MSIFVKDKAVRDFIHDYKKQIGKDALRAIDAKVGDYLLSCMRQWNGHKRIDATVINFVSIGGQK